MNIRGRILVLGGYGQFGQRISRALAATPGIEIVIAGRDPARAQALAAQLCREYPGSRVGAALVDIEHPLLARQVGAVAPIVVVHAAGPFQQQDYAVAEACLACRSHYVDLADARRFVASIGMLDRDARRRDVLLCSGASTLPGVSSAVVDELSADMSSVASIETSIVPAGQSRRGEATIAAVLGYCGKPFDALEKGAWTTRHGWLDNRLVDYPPFSRRVAVCDVPDLELFPQRYRDVETVTFHAGPESRCQLGALRIMASLARFGIVADWSRYARWLARADALWVRCGTDVGAMQIRVSGHGTRGERLTRVWNLTARSNHGPQIPCIPAIVLARRLLAGAMSTRGAQPCLGLVDFRQITAELARFAIDWHVDEVHAPC
jgi:hypothetical protein